MAKATEGCKPEPSVKVDAGTTAGEEKRCYTSTSVATITDARAMVDGLVAQLYEASEGRRNTEQLFNESTFYGTLLAVAGIAADRIGARNIGAGVAGLSSAVSGHYQPRLQINAFKKSLSQARCLRAALNGIDANTYNLFTDNYLGKVGDVDADEAFSQIPQITFERVNDIAVGLTNSLDEIDTASPSLSDLKSIALKVSDAAAKAKEAPKQEPTASTLNEMVASKKAVKKAQDNLDAAKAAYVNDLAAKKVKAFDAAGLMKPEFRSSLLDRTVALENALKFNESKLKDAATKAGEEVARKRAFLSGVVQYSASAEACVKLGSAE